jgi:hypothetical protein
MRRLKHVIKKLLGMSSQPSPPPTNPARLALWSVGIYAGPSPLALAPVDGIRNPVITRDSVTDVPASFVADPFLLRADGTWHLFFEVLNRTNGRGEIGVATSRDLAQWRYQGIVLAEPVHLSYPFVFEWEGARYMVPESHQASAIRLYRAETFPTGWTHVHTLMSGQRFADTTLFRHDDHWWLFTQTSAEGKHDNLRLFFADDLFGAWTEHPASPIIEDDPHSARPAGRVVETAGHLLRFAQDCKPRYGLNVLAFEITRLTTTHYAECPASISPILGGTQSGWNGARMHHVDAHQIEPGKWIAAVDGASNATRAEIDGTDSHG